MQNKHVADLADFGKYGLLRTLCNPDPSGGCQPLSLGVVWYLNQDDGKDGKELAHHDYLMDKPEFEECDPDLYGRLKKIWCSKRLEVASVEEDKVLPDGTVFYGEPVPNGKGKEAADKEAERAKWAKQAVGKVSDAECNVVFADPDNGILPSGTKPNPKHAESGELTQLAQAGRSAVVYQHHNRSAPIAGQVYHWQTRIHCDLGPSFAMVFTKARATFFIIPSSEHRELLLARAKAMLQGPWAQHFMMVGEERFLDARVATTAQGG